MELELKILKEKVVEDEKKSGIGSLFDDEKSSFQHISLLKEKYQKMRRDFDRKIEELNKLKLNAMGEQFVLDSQINVLLDHTTKFDDQRFQFKNNNEKLMWELEKEFKTISKLRMDLELSLREMEHEMEKEDEINYEDKMSILREQEFQKLEDDRYDLECQLDEKLINRKDEEVATAKNDRTQIKVQFESNKTLQQTFLDQQMLIEQVEEATVDLQLLNLQVRCLENETEYLNEKKDEFQEEKRIADLKHDELRKEAAAKEEINQKRLQAKLNRDKTVQTKELLAQEETATQHNAEMEQKMKEEMIKYEGLLDEKMDVEETLKRTNETFENVREKLRDQYGVIDKLKGQIGAQQNVVDDIVSALEEESKVHKVEEERYRKLSQTNAALKAKLDFINSKFDIASNVNHLNSDDFKSLMTTNNLVNDTVREFVTKLDVVKEEM